MLIASCATKNGVLITAAGWLGPSITGITIAPAAPYYVGDDVTVTVTAAATGEGTLTYAWTLDGAWGTVTGGDETAAIDVHLDAEGTATGSVIVTETIGEGETAESKTAEETFEFAIAAPLNAAPVIASLEADGYVVTATFSDADGDDLTVTWETDFGAITPGAADNTTAEATFEPPVGESGTAVITCTVSDGIADAVDTVDIAYVAGLPEIAEDTIALYAPVPTVAVGEFTYVFVYAHVAAAKPLGNLNAVRLLVSNSELLCTGIGCLTQSETNFMFSNDFAMSMEGDTTSGGDALYTAYVGFDAWAGFGDQDEVALLASPPLPQATFVDAGINWGSNTMTAVAGSEAIIAVLKFRGTGAGTASIEIQGNDGTSDRTFYSDLDGNTYTFANIGPAIDVEVT